MYQQSWYGRESILQKNLFDFVFVILDRNLNYLKLKSSCATSVTKKLCYFAVFSDQTGKRSMYLKSDQNLEYCARV